MEARSEQSAVQAEGSVLGLVAGGGAAVVGGGAEPAPSLPDAEVGVAEAVVHGVDGPLEVTQSHRAATELRTGSTFAPQASRTQPAAAPWMAADAEHWHT